MKMTDLCRNMWRRRTWLLSIYVFCYIDGWYRQNLNIPTALWCFSVKKAYIVRFSDPYSKLKLFFPTSHFTALEIWQ